MRSFWFAASVSALVLAVDNILGQAHAQQPSNSRLSIVVPRSLYEPEGYDHRVSLFGMPPSGAFSISQTVYYADSEFCDPNDDPSAAGSKGYPPAPWLSPFILMVDRGTCSFVAKVRNAQKAGASAVLIANNSCLCSDSGCLTAPGGGSRALCEISEPIMADDGSGSDVSIPSFLMWKQDADKVKDELKSGIPVVVEMSWSLPKMVDFVEYELWTSPVDEAGKKFLSDFRPVAKALGGKARFTPHTNILDGIAMHCAKVLPNGRVDENLCADTCTNMGRYCAPNHEEIVGADVVKESLRRLCIWKLYGETDGVGEAWWTYTEYFGENCGDSKGFSRSDDDCVNNAYDRSGVDGEKIDHCMAYNGGVEKDMQNSLFDSEIAIQRQVGIVSIPTATVNSAALRGELSSNSVFGAICAGFAEGSVPEICLACGKSSNPTACIESFEPTSSPTQQPTSLPTQQPTSSPTQQPTSLPTQQPTSLPTQQPTSLPTQQPTSSPTQQPTLSPTQELTSSHTQQLTSPIGEPTPLLNITVSTKEGNINPIEGHVLGIVMLLGALLFVLTVAATAAYGCSLRKRPRQETRDKPHRYQVLTKEEPDDLENT